MLTASHTHTLEQLPGLVADSAARAGLHNTAIYLADLQQDTLHLLTGAGLDAGQTTGDERERAVLPIEDTDAGRAYQYVRPVLATAAAGSSRVGGRQRWWVPLLDGAERVGVLGADLATGGSQETEDLERLAQLVTLLVVSKRDQSDSYARLVRTRQMNVAAEMQWHLLPPLSFTNHGVSVSAVMEPAYQIAGDTFDYGIADGKLHLSLFDAMGHDVAAGLTANLASAACRNHRRQNVALADLGGAIEQTLIEHSLDKKRYLTAVLAELDLTTGELSWTNHGHHPPVVIRDNTWFSTLHCPPSHPLGTHLDLPVTVCREQLHPGDRILLYTDGITEARHPHDNTEFGLERLVDFLIHHTDTGLPVAEVLRRLIHSVMDYHHGHLTDDATVLLLEARDSSSKAKHL
ncbi:PP2C family protein-serine/threonine phosphatase [Streptomyces sp. CA-256286]|uniref:PP2C family protein-serine/threonine phosphatase n=1 Tax=Streptomyces sp. CA-256286 TaxID=2801033 RepID=UPI001F61B28B|nr:PP2C family protein-serine/threonine phosphatase [Streptomyces sp. CA-256286]